jgi:hypothetical protein
MRRAIWSRNSRTIRAMGTPQVRKKKKKPPKKAAPGLVARFIALNGAQNLWSR